MKWRIVMEVTRADGAVRVHEIGGGAAVDEYSPRTVGLTLAEGKLATDCGYPALPGLRARPIRRRLRNCRVEAMALSREREFYRSVAVRSHGANRAVKIRHRMPGLR
jgi:hypothetical protein